MIDVEIFRKRVEGEQFPGVGVPAEHRSDDASSVPPLREVFRAEAGFVLRVLRRLGVPERDLEDAVQDVFVVVHRRLPDFDASQSLRSWLFGIARRIAVARRRRAHVRYEESLADLDTAARGAAPDASERIEARALLLRALERLDDDKRAAFVLYELEGFSIQEVAAAVDCPLQTAYSRLRAARDFVRSSIERALRERRP